MGDLRPAAPPGRPDRPWLQWYDADVPADVEVPDAPFAELLDRAAERWPGSPAVRHLGRELTYRELRHDAEQFSTALARLGVGQGDRVALVLPNCPQLVVALFGVLRLGAVAVPLEPARPAAELAAVLSDAGAAVVVCADRVLEPIAALRDEAGSPVRDVVVTLTTDYLPALDRIALAVPTRSGRRERARASGSVPPGAGIRLWADELRRARGVPAPAPRPAELSPAADAAVLTYPPVTTGDAPVGLVWTSRNLWAAGAQAAAWLTNARPGRESVLVGLPLSMPEGLALCLGAGTMLGAALQLVAPVPADADTSPTAMGGVRPTVAIGPPAFLDDLLDADSADEIDLRSLRLCVTGPDLLDAGRAARLVATSGAALVDGLSVPGAPVLLGRPVRSDPPPGSGVPLPSVEVRIVDAAGVPLPPGRPGRLEVRGPQVFTGFWRRPERTAAVLSDGWLRTDAHGCLHGDGRVEVVPTTG